MVCSMRLKRRPLARPSARAIPPVSRCGNSIENLGPVARVQRTRSASKSRGVACPSVMRLVIRSRSITPSRVSRISSRRTVWDFSSPTASNRFSISSTAINGRRIHERSSRAPIPVTVSSKRGKQSHRVTRPASSGNSGVTSSKFRTDTLSSASASCCS